MNLDDYEKNWFSTYRDFAETVRFILMEALRAADGLRQPQSVQCRAKGTNSLRRRLAEADKLDTKSLEQDRRDLAGVRLIFYTNNDIDRFLRSSVIRGNFEVEEDSTKLHYPTPDNNGTRYRAVHYTVRLGKERTQLPEYARFAGLRCEVQIQTILDHAWSETSHDIIYKNRLGDGFGRKAMEGITRRFERIMDRYLKPAGFEIQKAQQEYERLLQGKSLFDKDIANLLDNAPNNNERYEVLAALRDYAIPNFDDLPEAYAKLREPLLRAVKAARCSAPVPIQTNLDRLDGFNADAVTRLVVEIVESLRYSDIVGTLRLLIDIYRDEQDEGIRRQIATAAKRLSEYNIHAYNQVGPTLQMELLDCLAGMSVAEIDNVRPIALTIWSEALRSDITGTTYEADSLTIRTGAVPYSDLLECVRNKAISALFATYDRSTDDAQKREVLSALDPAMTTPDHVPCAEQLVAATFRDAAQIVEYLTERAEAASYELLQHLEHRFFFEYLRVVRVPDDQSSCKSDAASLKAAILKFRDVINRDDRFVRYKVLVGFESVFSHDWTDEKLHWEGADEYRLKEADRYIDDITAANESCWFDLIVRCAQTKSNDLATFLIFDKFIERLAERRPDVAERLLRVASDALRNFLPDFLNGFARCGQSEVYERVLEDELACAKALAYLARHLRNPDVKKPEFANRVLEAAIEKDDSTAVIECLLFAIEHYGTEKITDGDAFVRDALSYLNAHKDTRWVRQAWFRKRASRFFQEVNSDRVKEILRNLSFLPRVDYEAEAVLTRLAERQPEAVWDYFGTRLARESANGENEDGFEAAPFHFHGLEKELSKDPQLGIKKGLSWFAHDSDLFEYRGGRVLSSAFPNCPPGFAAALASLVKSGNTTEVDFALAILQNYHGANSTHIVLKEIVSRCSDDQRRMSKVRTALDSTGVVFGEFGIADSYRAKKKALEGWLTDECPAIKAFAEKHISELDLMIASECARVEEDGEMRKRDYEQVGDKPDADQ